MVCSTAHPPASAFNNLQYLLELLLEYRILNSLMGSDYIGMKMLKEQAIKGCIHDTTCNYEEGSGFYV